MTKLDCLKNKLENESEGSIKFQSTIKNSIETRDLQSSQRGNGLKKLSSLAIPAQSTMVIAEVELDD